MNSNFVMMYFNSEYIINFFSSWENRIHWMKKGYANGAGNLLTPTPAMGMFFELLSERGELFNQKEYFEYAIHHPDWSRWWQSLADYERNGLMHRLYRNFYPSAVDTLHAWSLLVESGEFSSCTVDLLADVVAKTDITVESIDGIKVKLDLSAGDEKAYKYKRNHRGKDEFAVRIVLPLNRMRGVGNKIWYVIDDFRPVFLKLNDIRAGIEKKHYVNEASFELAQLSLFDF